MNEVFDLNTERRRRIEDAIGVLLAADPVLAYEALLDRGADRVTAANFQQELVKVKDEVAEFERQAEELESAS